MGPAENRRDGFLKLEFMAHLNAFPDWSKTKVYCRGFEIYHCETGKKVTKEEMKWWAIENNVNKKHKPCSAKTERALNDTAKGGATENVSYRLQRYEITKRSNNEIVWKTRGGRGAFNGGGCSVLEDILFIGPGQNIQIPLDKRQFLGNLEKLPEWSQTKYYCTKLSLHECNTGIRIQESRKRRTRERRTTEKKGTKKAYKKSAAFHSIISDLSEKTAIFLSLQAKKWLSHIVHWIGLTMPVFLSCLTRLWESLRRKRH